jgi:hypothetical protein
MALNKQLQEAGDRLRTASMRIDEARAKPATPHAIQEWPAALTEYALALGEVYDLNMEALQERVEDIDQRQRRSIAVND